MIDERVGDKSSCKVHRVLVFELMLLVFELMRGHHKLQLAPGQPLTGGRRVTKEALSELPQI